jgi:GntR family transcriptional regulator
MSSEPGGVLDRLQPRFHRVRSALIGELTRDHRAPGWRLPPERALAEHFGVSRVTLRRAMQELERDGILTRDGRGWAVAAPRIGEPPNELMSFSEMAATRGLRPAAHVLAARLRPATIDESDVLGVAPGATLFELERVRSMDEVPILVDRSVIPHALVPGIERADFASASLYETFEGRFGIRPTRARFSVEAVAADQHDAEALEVEVGQPLLRCLQVTEDAHRRVIEWCEMRYRGDRYRFRATLVRANPSAAPSDASHRR